MWVWISSRTLLESIQNVTEIIIIYEVYGIVFDPADNRRSQMLTLTDWTILLLLMVMDRSDCCISHIVALHCVLNSRFFMYVCSVFTWYRSFLHCFFSFVCYLMHSKWMFCVSAPDSADTHIDLILDMSYNVALHTVHFLALCRQCVGVGIILSRITVIIQFLEHSMSNQSIEIAQTELEKQMNYEKCFGVFGNLDRCRLESLGHNLFSCSIEYLLEIQKSNPSNLKL